MQVKLTKGSLYIGGTLSSENMTATAVIAYFNAGAESEYLGLWQEAQYYYDFALKLVGLGSE